MAPYKVTRANNDAGEPTKNLTELAIYLGARAFASNHFFGIKKFINDNGNIWPADKLVSAVCVGIVTDIIHCLDETRRLFIPISE